MFGVNTFGKMYGTGVGVWAILSAVLQYPTMNSAFGERLSEESVLLYRFVPHRMWRLSVCYANMAAFDHEI